MCLTRASGGACKGDIRLPHRSNKEIEMDLDRPCLLQKKYVEPLSCLFGSIRHFMRPHTEGRPLRRTLGHPYRAPISTRESKRGLVDGGQPLATLNLIRALGLSARDFSLALAILLNY